MRILPLLIGFLCGAGAILAFDYFRASRPGAEALAAQSAAEKSAQEIQTLRAQLKSSAEQVTRLQAAQARPSPPTAQAKPPQASAAGPTSFLQEMVKSQLKQMNEGRGTRRADRNFGEL